MRSVSVLLLFQTIEHVRFRKRAELLMEEGAEVEVLAFERGSYPGKKLPCPCRSLGKLKHQNYLKRIYPFVKSLKIIRNHSKKNDYIYAFGLDMLLLGWLSTVGMRKKYIYEVGDIREILVGKRIKNRLARWLERFLLNRTNLLVVTSFAYITEYYNKIQNIKNIEHITIENKLERNLSGPFEYNEKGKNNLLRIGYYGVLRCIPSWFILKKAASESNGLINLYLRGITRMYDIKKEIEAIENITYGGPYISPDELPNIYGCVDIVWACAPIPYRGVGLVDWQWARAIRFYEACYFKKPVIVQAETEDSKYVDKYDIGLIIDMRDDIEQVVEKVKSITEEDLTRWKENLEKLPESIYVYQDEHNKLVQKINKMQ